MNQAVFSTCPKKQDKNLNISRMIRAFKMKWRVFFIIFKGPSSKQINNFLLEVESLTLRNSSINWIFLWSLPIQNHLKLSITEKRRNKAKYQTWNSIRLKFVKKTSMQNPVKSLGYIKCHSSSSPRSVKNPSNSMEKICSWSRRPKIILEIRKKATFL